MVVEIVTTIFLLLDPVKVEVHLRPLLSTLLIVLPTLPNLCEWTKLSCTSFLMCIPLPTLTPPSMLPSPNSASSFDYATSPPRVCNPFICVAPPPATTKWMQLEKLIRHLRPLLAMPTKVSECHFAKFIFWFLVLLWCWVLQWFLASTKWEPKKGLGSMEWCFTKRSFLNRFSRTI